MSVKDYFDSILALPDEEFDDYVKSLGFTEKIVSQDTKTTELLVSTIGTEYKFTLDLQMETVTPDSYYITQKVA